MSRNTLVLDDTDRDDSVAPVQYNISSYGADYDVEGLVNRLKREDIFIPTFQRDYVWNLTEASGFIESLLLGLPVPGVFLARDPLSNRLLVIDGQQRLKSLQFFFEGFFNPRDDDKSKRVFRLTSVQLPFEGLTYNTLGEEDRRMLNDSIIHATIVKQEEPKDNDTSIYHIFKRLNTTGRKLSAQQIRVAIYHGEFIEQIRELNNYPNWRSIFGKVSPTLKDQELILRFLALHFAGDQYARPMQEFLNVFTISGRKKGEDFRQQCATLFISAIDAMFDAVGPRAFRLERALNAAVFDATIVGLASRLSQNRQVDRDALAAAYYALIANTDFVNVVSQSTSDEKNVESRLRIATEAFMDI